MKKETIALVGGTGPIGKSVVAALRQESRPYRIIGRSQESLQRMAATDPLAEIATYDPENMESIKQAIRGVSVVIYMVGVLYNEFQLYPILKRRFLDAAVAEKVDRMLLIGTLYVFGRAQTDRITENHPREPHTFKGRKRKEQEDLVLEAHRTGKIKAAVLRLPDFYGPGVEKSYLADLFIAAKQNRKAKMLGPIDKPHEFIFVPDVGPVVVKLLDTPEAFGHAWNLGGAGVTTQLELARLAFNGPPRYMVIGKFLLRLGGLFNPILRELVEMHYLLMEPLIVDDSALQRLLGNIKKTPYAEGVKLSLISRNAAAD